VVTHEVKGPLHKDFAVGESRDDVRVYDYWFSAGALRRFAKQ